MRLVIAGNTPRVKRKSLAGQCVLVLLGLQVVFLSSFVALNLPTGTGHNLINSGRHYLAVAIKELPLTWQERLNSAYPINLTESKPIRYSIYVPEVPAAIFLGYVLGRQIAPLSIALFVLLGLFGPIFGINPFADGGGLDYYSHPSFGYLLGLIASSFIVGWITQERRSSFNQVLALVAGVLSAHLIGLTYLIGSCLLFAVLQGTNSGPTWLPWVFELARNLTWYPLPYDFIFGLLLIGVGFPIRYTADMLSSPDIALKSRNDLAVQQHLEELLS
jgi:biotin transporter BioY